jgi:hypothetical protein
VDRYIGRHRTVIHQAQLTAKGIAIIKQPIGAGDTIEKRIQAQGDGGASWGPIGELIGGAAGAFAKAISSAG